LVFFRVRGIVIGWLGVLGELVVYIVLGVVLGGLRVMMCPERLKDIYIDSFKSYLDLREAGYRNEYVKHSEGECHINEWENEASILRPWLAVHRSIYKACRKFRKMKPYKQ